MLHADKHQCFCKFVLSFLMKVVRHVQSTRNRKLVTFLKYLKQKVSQLLLCSIVMQNIQIFLRGFSRIRYLICMKCSHDSHLYICRSRDGKLKKGVIPSQSVYSL